MSKIYFNTAWYNMLLVSIALVLAICSGCGAGSGWSETIARQNKQPNSNAEIDSIVEKFLKTYDIPGFSLAIAKNDSLLYVKAYGYADIDTQKEVTDSSLFRIGAMSQPLTAMAILKLLEQKKITFDEKVFGNEGILGNDFGNNPKDTRVKEFTIKELLNNSAGWEKNNNITLVPSSFTAAKLLQLLLDSVPLQSAPGKDFNFSFLNCMVLEKVIEKVTGKKYTDYMHEAILDPIGCVAMKPAGNYMRDRQRNEVTHYMWRFMSHDDTEEPYKHHLSEMQAACGWLASATDLIKVMVRVDKFNNKPDMFSDSIMNVMLTPLDTNSHFAGGWWSNNKFQNWFSVGAFPSAGILSEMARADNGYCWVMLANKTPGAKYPEADDGMDRMIWEIINDKKVQWPKVDLFEGR